MGRRATLRYFRFSELFGGTPAQDRVRGQRIPAQSPTLDTLGVYCFLTRFVLMLCHLDEAFTSENWIVRIYKVKKEDPIGRDLKAVSAFNSGKRLKKTKSTGAGGKKGRPSL